MQICRMHSCLFFKSMVLVGGADFKNLTFRRKTVKKIPYLSSFKQHSLPISLFGARIQFGIKQLTAFHSYSLYVTTKCLTFNSLSNKSRNNYFNWM